ncbi:hypothetical protein [Peromfec virus RodF5_7]|uniref:Uncharacterized protein n=1 Tax=Peromfec virus RodF5_7 TaxID=2929343 RepID=A0A976R7V1_9VIRU|nr:hypothetical protein [Peromfec virus RodF5_7]
MEHIFTYRYLVQTGDNKDQIKIKLVSDVMAGHNDFIERTIAELNPVRFAREYVCEYDCSKVMLVEPISSVEIDKEVIDSETASVE